MKELTGSLGHQIVHSEGNVLIPAISYGLEDDQPPIFHKLTSSGNLSSIGEGGVVRDELSI